MLVSVRSSWADAAAEAASRVQEGRGAGEDARPGRCVLRWGSRSDRAAGPGWHRRPEPAPPGFALPGSGSGPAAERLQLRQCSQRAAPRGAPGCAQRSTEHGPSQLHPLLQQNCGRGLRCSRFHRQRQQGGCLWTPGRPAGLYNPRRAWRWWWSVEREHQVVVESLKCVKWKTIGKYELLIYCYKFIPWIQDNRLVD